MTQDVQIEKLLLQLNFFKEENADLKMEKLELEKKLNQARQESEDAQKEAMFFIERNKDEVARAQKLEADLNTLKVEYDYLQEQQKRIMSGKQTKVVEYVVLKSNAHNDRLSDSIRKVESLINSIE